MIPQTPASSKGKAPSVLDTTPSSRIEKGKPLSDGAKNRVRNIDPNGNRCLVENCDEKRAVEFAHVFPKWYSNRHGNEMDSIEWYWNMAHQTLNLDTRWNVMRLGSSIHYLFDRYAWVLVPEGSIVEQYYNSLSHSGLRSTANRARFPNIENRRDFRYTFIPIDDDIMPQVALLRQNDPPKDPPQNNPFHNALLQDDSHNNNRPPLTSNDFVVHTNPFNTLPVLESHVHPKFVILEAGLAMSKLDNEIYAEFAGRYPILSKILRIYRAWTAGIPKDAMKDRNYNAPKPDRRENDGDSEYTTPRRETPQKRQRQDVPETPTPAAASQRASGSRTQGKQHALKRQPSVSLSKKSLELYDRTVGMGNWTDEEVQKWSEGCRPLPRKVHTPWAQLQTRICV